MRFSFVFLLGGGGGVGGEKKKKVTELYSEESTAVPSAKGLEAIHLAVDDRSTPAHFSLSLFSDSVLFGRGLCAAIKHGAGGW